MDFALLLPDLNEMLAQADTHRLGYTGPIHGSRVTPKGDRLEWQLGRPVSAELPFFCADITRRPLRVAEGKVRTQPNHVQGIASVAVAVKDAAAALVRYRHLLSSQGESVAFADVGPVGELGLDASTVTINGAEIILVSAHRSATTPSAVWLNSLLAKRGPGAYALTARIPHGAAPHLYGPAQARGVHIELSVDDVPLTRRVFPAGA